MIRTSVVDLSVIKGIAYRMKLPSGGSGIIIFREGASQPGIASISKTSGEAIPASNTPKDTYPQEAFSEAIALTAGLPYKKRGSVQLKGDRVTEDAAPAEAETGQEAEEVIVNSDEYLKVVEKYSDKTGKVSYALLNRDMIKFAHSSSTVRKMIGSGTKPEDITLYVAGSKFRSVTGNPGLTDTEVSKMLELLDEVSPKGVLREFNEEIRRSLSAAKK